MGQKNDANRKALSLYPFVIVISFKNISLNFDFIYFFSRFSNVKA